MKKVILMLAVIASVVILGGYVDRVITSYNNTHVTIEMAERCSMYVNNGGDIADCD